MRSVNATFSTAIALGKLIAVELFTIELQDSTTYRFTSAQEDKVWDAGSNTYSSKTIGRTSIQYSNNFESDSVSVFIGRISEDLHAKAQAGVLDYCQVTIKRILWGDSYAADKEITLFIGVADVEFDRQILRLNCRPLEDTLNVKVPRCIYQEECNYKVFDANCGLTRADYAYVGTATGGSVSTLIDTTRGAVYTVPFDGADEDNPIVIGETITGGDGGGTGVVVQIIYLTAVTGIIWYVEQTGVQFVGDEVLTANGDTVVVNGTPAIDNDFYTVGELEITSGDNSGSRRQIDTDDSGTITVLWPYQNVIAAGDTYNIYPGCRGLIDDCENKFDNLVKNRSFLTIPKVQEAMF